jgi:sensor domain CHASE-containing protein
MPHASWHIYLMILSVFAAIAGLALLLDKNHPFKDDAEGTERVLLMMSFTYWLVHCLAIGAQRLILPEWETLMLSVKLTGLLAYLLTFACVLSLPLHKVAVRQME